MIILRSIPLQLREFHERWGVMTSTRTGAMPVEARAPNRRQTIEASQRRDGIILIIIAPGARQQVHMEEEKSETDNEE